MAALSSELHTRSSSSFSTYDLGSWLLFVAAVDDGDDGLCQIDEGQAGGGVATEGGGGACITIVADALYERDLSQ